MPAGRATKNNHGSTGGVETTSGPRPSTPAAATTTADDADDKTTQDNVTERYLSYECHFHSFEMFEDIN